MSDNGSGHGPTHILPKFCPSRLRSRIRIVPPARTRIVGAGLMPPKLNWPGNTWPGESAFVGSLCSTTLRSSDWPGHSSGRHVQASHQVSAVSVAGSTKPEAAGGTAGVSGGGPCGGAAGGGGPCCSRATSAAALDPNAAVTLAAPACSNLRRVGLTSGASAGAIGLRIGAGVYQCGRAELPKRSIRGGYNPPRRYNSMAKKKKAKVMRRKTTAKAAAKSTK